MFDSVTRYQVKAKKEMINMDHPGLIDDLKALLSGRGMSFKEKEKALQATVEVLYDDLLNKAEEPKIEFVSEDSDGFNHHVLGHDEPSIAKPQD